MEAYCMKCRKKVTAIGVVDAVTANDRAMSKGKCPVCGTTVCRMGSTEKTAGK